MANLQVDSLTAGRSSDATQNGISYNYDAHARQPIKREYSLGSSAKSTHRDAAQKEKVGTTCNENSSHATLNSGKSINKRQPATQCQRDIQSPRAPPLLVQNGRNSSCTRVDNLKNNTSTIVASSHHSRPVSQRNISRTQLFVDRLNTLDLSGCRIITKESPYKSSVLPRSPISSKRQESPRQPRQSLPRPTDDDARKASRWAEHYAISQHIYDTETVADIQRERPMIRSRSFNPGSRSRERTDMSLCKHDRNVISRTVINHEAGTPAANAHDIRMTQSSKCSRGSSGATSMGNQCVARQHHQQKQQPDDTNQQEGKNDSNQPETVQPSSASTSDTSSSEEKTPALSLPAEYTDLNDCIRYLHTELCGEDQQTMATDSNMVLVRDIMSKAVHDIRSSETLSAFGHMIAPFDLDSEMTGSDLVLQVAPGMFRVRVFLENPFPAGTFQLLTGVRHGINSGQGLLSLNPTSLTLVEKRHVMKTYKGFFDGDYLSSSKATNLLYKGLQLSFDKLHGSVWHDSRLYITTNFHSGKITATLHLLPRHRDSSEQKERVVTLRLFPAMMTSGWPSGACLQHPLPRQRPHSMHGQRMLKEMQEAVEAGAQLLCLDGTIGPPPLSSSSGSSSSASVSSQLTARSRTSNSLSGRMHRVAAVVHGSAWTVSFRYAEKRLVEYLFAYDLMRDARLAYDVLGALQRRRRLWGMLTPAVRRTVLLWSVKRAGVAEKTPADWLLLLVTFARKVFSSAYCPQFFQPNVNILAGVDVQCFAYISNDLDMIVQEATDRPAVLLQTT